MAIVLARDVMAVPIKIIITDLTGSINDAVYRLMVIIVDICFLSMRDDGVNISMQNGIVMAMIVILGVTVVDLRIWCSVNVRLSHMILIGVSVLIMDYVDSLILKINGSIKMALIAIGDVSIDVLMATVTIKRLDSVLDMVIDIFLGVPVMKGSGNVTSTQDDVSSNVVLETWEAGIEHVIMVNVAG